MWPWTSLARPPAPCQMPPPCPLAVDAHAVLRASGSVLHAMIHPQALALVSLIEPKPMKTVLTPWMSVSSRAARCLRAAERNCCACVQGSGHSGGCGVVVRRLTCMNAVGTVRFSVPIML
jgi:hypothetical protein